MPVELLGRTPFPPIGELPYLLTLPAHGFYWFRLATDARGAELARGAPRARGPAGAGAVRRLDSFFRDRVVPWRIGMAEKMRAQLEADVLPRYLETQRWYAAKGERDQARAALADHALWEDGGDTWMLPLLDVEGAGESRHATSCRSRSPGKTAKRSACARSRRSTVAQVRQQASVGVLADAFGDERFCRAVRRGHRSRRRSCRTARGRLRFAPTARVRRARRRATSTRCRSSTPQAQSSNTIVTFGERLFLKGYRRVRRGVNPELEIGRFLTEVAQLPELRAGGRRGRVRRRRRQRA